MREEYTYSAVLDMIRARIAKQGTAQAVAKDFGISPQYLSDILKERRGLGPKVLKALGLKHERRFEIIKQKGGAVRA